MLWCVFFASFMVGSWTQEFKMLEQPCLFGHFTELHNACSCFQWCLGNFLVNRISGWQTKRTGPTKGAEMLSRKHKKNAGNCPGSESIQSYLCWIFWQERTSKDDARPAGRSMGLFVFRWLRKEWKLVEILLLLLSIKQSTQHSLQQLRPYNMLNQSCYSCKSWKTS